MNYLDIEIYSNDLDQQITLREYFKKLLTQLWIDEEGFNGKRPFGNSGWQYDVYTALIKHGIIPGKIDFFGYISEIDEVEAQQFIIKLIKEL
jgi:hypothetical protein